MSSSWHQSPYAHHCADAIALAFETTVALVKIPSHCWYVVSSSSVLATQSATFLRSRKFLPSPQSGCHPRRASIVFVSYILNSYISPAVGQAAVEYDVFPRIPFSAEKGVQYVLFFSDLMYSTSRMAVTSAARRRHTHQPWRQSGRLSTVGCHRRPRRRPACTRGIGDGLGLAGP